MMDFLFNLLPLPCPFANGTRQEISVIGDFISKLIWKKSEQTSSICLVGSRDTAAGTLSWFIYMLCKHPNPCKWMTSLRFSSTRSLEIYALPSLLDSIMQFHCAARWVFGPER